MATQYRHHPTSEIIAASAATKHFYGQIQLCGIILGRYLLNSVEDPGCLSLILDPGSDFFHPGSRADNIPDPDLYKIYFIVFWTQKTDSKFSKIRSGMFKQDPGSGFFPSRIRIPDSGAKKSSDPGSVFATLIWIMVFESSVFIIYPK